MGPSGNTILVIDDEPDTLSSIGRILRSDGYDVDTARSVVEALDRDNWSDYFAILLDLKLPDGHAEEFVPKVIELAPEAAIIIITGHADLDSSIAALRLGVEDYLLKPVDPDYLRRRLQRINELRLSREALQREEAQRRRAEEASKRSEDEFRFLAENVPALFAFVGADERYRFVNKRYEQDFGLSASEVVGKHIKDVLGEETYDTVKEHIATTLNGQPVSFELAISGTRSDQRWLDVDYVPHHNEQGQIDGFFALIVDITERKRVDGELQWMSKVFTDSAEAIFIKDLSGRVMDLNAAAERRYGWTRDELVGQSIKILIPQEEHAQRDELMDRCLRGEEVRSIEGRRVTKDGNSLPVLLSFSLLTDESGQPIGIATFSEDISRQKAAEEELRVKDHAIHSAITGFAFGNLDGEISYANPGFVKMFGYEDAREVVGRMNTELTSDVSMIREIMIGVKAQGFWQGEDIARKKDGTPFPIELAVALMKDPNGEPLGMVATFIDITQRQQAEEELRRRTNELAASEERLLAILNAAVDSIVTIDHDGIIVGVNSTTMRMFGYTEEELIGQNVKILMPSPYREEHDTYIARYQETGEARIIGSGSGRELVGKRKDGSTFPASLAISEVEKLKMFTGIVRDITDEKRSRERLLQSERLAAIGEAMTGLVHESRNAMASVQAQLRMLSRRITDRPELGQYIDGALKSQLEVRKLFEEVRQWAAPKKLDIKPCDLGELLRETWEKLETQWAGRTVALREHHESGDLVCEADRFSLGQVFRNIFENAFAACEDPVEVDAEYREVHCGDRTAVQVTIRDNGPGLATEQRERMFEAFYTTKTHGTGLGMPIALRTMQAHNGDIEIGPGNGRGAEFILTIPRTHL